MDSEVFDLTTGARVVTDITDRLASFCHARGDGLLSVFVPHATAGVTIMETNAGSEPDLESALERLLPVEDIYTHRHGSTGHGRDHVLPAFVSSSLVVPVLDGVMTLGTWQSVVVVDTNADNPRRHVRMSFIPG